MPQTPTPRIFVKPVPDRSVRDPETLQLLKPEGECKPRTSFWLKRIRQGDVELVEETQKSVAPAISAPAETPEPEIEQESVPVPEPKKETKK